ncbi:von Willebrand factor A domain-containing protein 3B-like isoform X3 [Sycon ciliatum]|uniref:von Willebrand factor A domain-containing protein 3B-like isoform X3 n=1 Tax=Sycon ciliatum TaxID=27933 RepID=UPI0031F6D149
MEAAVSALVDSPAWLQVYGLQRQKLTLPQVLATVGFKHSEAYVRGVGRPVEARYNRGLFPQYQGKDGTVYNLTASPHQLENIGKKVLSAIELLKKRLEFLTTGSRKVFGAIHARRPIIVVNAVESHVGQESSLHDVVPIIGDVVHEQLAGKEAFNIIWASGDIKAWRDSCQPQPIDVCSPTDAASWLGAQSRILPARMSNTSSGSSAAEALSIAMGDKYADAVYFFTEGSLTDSCRYILQNKAQTSGIPVNVIAFNCTERSTLDALKSISKLSGGICMTASSMQSDTAIETGEPHWMQYVRTHRATGGGAISPLPPLSKPAVSSWPQAPPLTPTTTTTTTTSRTPGNGLQVVREAVQLIWDELEDARNTLAELQALAYDLPRPQSAPLPHDQDRAAATSSPRVGDQDAVPHHDLFVSSKEWLQTHGIGARKLLLHDVLSGLAFRHCDSVVRFHDPMTSIAGEITPTSQDRLVGAKYCGHFAHFRWPDGSVVHIHVTNEIVRNYHIQMTKAIDSYLARIEWLRQGSRELFGTLIEDKVCIVIDASSSMKNRLDLVKAKLQILLQEQLRHKSMFNIMRFSSSVVSWRPTMVHVTSQNLQDAWRWILSLNAGGSTNTLAALRLALADASAQAVYVLTDGRPDQPPEGILAEVQLTSKVPIHTISFNCADSRANTFLHQLSQDTGGRYHYFSDDARDEHGPRPYESEDIHFLHEEVAKARADLKRMMELRQACLTVEQQQAKLAASKQTGKAGASPGSKRPNTNPAGVQRSTPASARKKAHQPAQASNSSVTSRQSVARGKVQTTVPLQTPRKVPDGHASDAQSDSASQLDQSESESQPDGSAKSYTSPTGSSSAAAESSAVSSASEIESATESQSSAAPAVSPRVQSTTLQSASASSVSSAVASKKRRPREKKSLKARHGYQSSQSWLQVHGLAACRLTILDALRPTVIEQQANFVPILNKHVSSRVFNEIMPLRHVADETGHVSIVNPQAVDLKSYEEKLSAALDKVQERLDTVVWKVLPFKKRARFSSTTAVSVVEHRDELLGILEELHWPIPKQDVMLLLEELSTGRAYLEQSVSLRSSSSAGTSQEQLRNILANPEVMKATLQALRPATAKSGSKPPARAKTPNPKFSKKTTSARSTVEPVPKLTLARFDDDGYFYEASVTDTLNARNIVVTFQDHHQQRMAKRHLIVVDRTKTRPKLMVGDNVLVQTSLPIPGAEDLQYLVNPPAMTCFVPAQVTVVPRQLSSSSSSLSPSTAFYTVRLFTSCKITTFRDDMIKISQTQYSFAIRYITSLEQADVGVQLTLFPEVATAASPRRVSPSTSRQALQQTAPLAQVHEETPAIPLAQSQPTSVQVSPVVKQRNGTTPQSLPVNSTPTRDATHYDDDQLSVASSTASSARQRRYSTHTLQQLSEQTGKLHALHGELVTSSARDKASIAEQCTALVRQHEETMALSQQLRQQHAEQAEQLRLQLLTEHKQQQDLVKCTIESTTELENERRRAAQEEHRGQVASLTAALDQQAKLQQQIEEQQRQQEQAFSVQRDKLLELAKGLERQQQDHASLVATDREKQNAEHVGRQQDLATMLESMKLQQEQLQQKQAELERAQTEVAAVHEQQNIEGLGSAGHSSLSSPLQASLSSLLDYLPEGAKLETVQTEDGEDAVLVRHGDVGVIISTTQGLESLSSSQIGISPVLERRAPPRVLAAGEEVIARSGNDGWFFPGIVQDLQRDGTYLVANGCGLLEAVARQHILSDQDDCANELNLGDPVLALHPSFVNSYAPGYVQKLKTDGKLKVEFYDGKVGRVERHDVYLISPEVFIEVSMYIRQQEASFVGAHVVARYNQDAFYYPGLVMSQQGASHTYAVQFTQSGVLHTQMVQHVFSRRTPQPAISLGCRVLAPLLADLSVYLPGWVSGEKGNLLTISFINGEQRRAIPCVECYWMSTLYYNQAIQFLKQLPPPVPPF